MTTNPHGFTSRSLRPVELASYAVTANILLNLDEVVTRE